MVSRVRSLRRNRRIAAARYLRVSNGHHDCPAGS